MALYVFDGTGNEDKPDDDQGGHDSNALHFFRAYDDPLKNDDPARSRGSLYLAGIGVRAHTKFGTLLSEAIGLGGFQRVNEMRARLKNNLEAGDFDIDVVGFSRGAALALSFANKVARDNPSLRIRFVGLWDVVGEFGVPGEHINAGHDLDLPSNVEHCYHAMALDECRALFPLTRLSGSNPKAIQQAVEAWFRGVHSDIGGGNGNFGLNWVALHWMYENARRHGLPISAAAIAANLLRKTLTVDIREHKLAIGPRRRIHPTDLLHASVRLDPTDTERQRNDPTFPLARIDDLGNVIPIQVTRP